MGAQVKIAATNTNDKNDPRRTTELQRTFRQVFSEILTLPCLDIDEYTAWILEMYPNVTWHEAVCFAMIRKATLGDVSAAAFIRDTMGESPKMQVALDSEKDTEISIKVIGNEQTK